MRRRVCAGSRRRGLGPRVGEQTFALFRGEKSGCFCLFVVLVRADRLPGVLAELPVRPIGQEIARNQRLLDPCAVFRAEPGFLERIAGQPAAQRRRAVIEGLEDASPLRGRKRNCARRQPASGVQRRAPALLFNIERLLLRLIE
ncbi:MAG TPA: hypothetical protein VJR30_13580 [Bradyrhizobium sp.]|nr:hypothetical protein [Bradyrhizobium sp.]